MDCPCLDCRSARNHDLQDKLDLPPWCCKFLPSISRPRKKQSRKMDRFVKPISGDQYFQSLREEDVTWRLKQMELSSESDAGGELKLDADIRENSQGETQHERKLKFRLSQVLERLARKRRGRSDGGQNVNQNRGKYFNWFENPHDWKKIEHALKICQFSPRRTVAYLRLKYNKPGIQNPFLGFNESTIRGWLTPDKTLKPSVLELIRHPNFSSEQHAVTSGVQGSDPPVVQRALPRGPGILGEFGSSVWSSRRELEKKFIDLLNKHREAGAALNATTVQFLLKGFLSVHNPSILLEHGPFRCSLSWIRRWLKESMGWSYRTATTAAHKLPADWKDQGRLMALRLAFLVAKHSIPEALVFNMDQTGVHLVPTGNRLYAPRGRKRVSVTGKNDKRQVTVCVASSAAGDLLPLQVIFEGKTSAVVPQSEAAVKAKHLGWHLTATPNHWSNMKSCQDWVNLVLSKHYVRVCGKFGLEPGKQKLVLILDCWSVHKSREFKLWLAETHLEICLIFVPANCTSELQPADVILQRPFKAAFQQHYSKWYVEQIQIALSAGIETINPKLDFSIGRMRKVAVEGLLHAHSQLLMRRKMIVEGWNQCMLLEAWSQSLQMEAFKNFCDGNLFPASSGGEAEKVELREEDQEDEEWFAEESIDGIMCERLGISPEDTLVEAQPESELISDFRFTGFVSGTVNFTDYLLNPASETPYIDQ